MKKSLLLTLFIFSLIQTQLFADSPLTSTVISNAYKSLKPVKTALKSNGKISPKTMHYLADNKISIEKRIAVINALGWNINGQNNASVFFDFLKNEFQYNDIEDLLNKADADIIICLAYLKAMDNYFEVDEAIKYAKLAKEKKKESYTVNIICAIIESQKEMTGDWCKVYQFTNDVRNKSGLKSDMKAGAVKIIFDYMDLYKSSCD
jgi:hypothetical protein